MRNSSAFISYHVFQFLKKQKYMRRRILAKWRGRSRSRWRLRPMGFLTTVTLREILKLLLSTKSFSYRAKC
jgi:hypothetical protein